MLLLRDPLGVPLQTGVSTSMGQNVAGLPCITAAAAAAVKELGVRPYTTAAAETIAMLARVRRNAGLAPTFKIGCKQAMGTMIGS